MIIRQTTASFSQVAAVISGGGVIAFRTDTFYGLGVDPFNRDAAQQIKELKGREDHKPILIVISDPHHVARFIKDISPCFEQLANAFWPGPLTLIGTAVSELPAEITAGTATVGIRLPNDESVCALVRACGGALTATSANPSHDVPAANALAVENYFGNEIDLIVDGGEARTDLPSTVVDASGSEPKLIREGVIPWARIQTADR